MKRLETRLAVIAMLLLLVAALGACGSKPAAMPVAATTPWVGSLLGAPSHVALVLRPSALFGDPYWGPAARRAMAKPSRHEDPDDIPSSQVASLASATQMEVYITVRDVGRAAHAPRDSLGSETVGYVFVMRGAGATNPQTFTTRRGERLFGAPVRLASGVVELPPTPAWGQRKRGLATSLFVLPDGTWVGVDQTTAARARQIYERTAEPPPPTAMESDALFAASVEKAVLDAATRRASIDAVWRQDLTSAGLVLVGGRNGAVEIVLEYANDDSAERAKTWIEDLLVAACKEHEMACLLVKAAIRDVKTSRDGRRIGVRFYLSELLLKRLSEE